MPEPVVIVAEERTITVKCDPCRNALVKAHLSGDQIQEVAFLGRLVIADGGASVVCRSCKTTKSLADDLGSALAGAVLLLVRARE